MTSRPPRGALVTGGSKRVGRALSLALASAGYRVAVHHRGAPDEAEAVVAEIAAAGGRARAVAADLDSPQEVGRLVERATEAVGPLTLLVNNASRFEKDASGDFTEESLLAHLRPNLIAPLLLVQAFAASAAGLDADVDASVINILDQRVFRPNPQFFSYTLSKAALHTATLTLAQALAPRVRVNAVAPGPTLPSVHQDKALFAAEAEGVLLQRPAALADITRAAIYLADAASVTGEIIVVDAGQHLAWRTPDIVAV